MMKKLCEEIDYCFSEMIKCLVLEELPDSRSVGGKIEYYVKQNWERFCETWVVTPQEEPGKRSLYDISFLKEDIIYGIDIKTKDNGDKKYSDGGIGGVKNLLEFYTKKKGIFLITEFGYKEVGRNYDFSYVKTAPFHCLPAEIYRIENLGTGQIRFNTSIKNIYDNIEWDRSVNEFLGYFADLATRHYEKVLSDTQRRIDSMNDFKESDFEELKLK